MVSELKEHLERDIIPFWKALRDDENGGYLACEYILENGGKNIAVINADQHISSAKDRLAGIKRCFLDNNGSELDHLNTDHKVSDS